MKITKRQLRRLIRETIYVDSAGTAIDYDSAPKEYENLIDDLLVLIKDFPNIDKVMLLVKSDDPESQAMGLELIDSLAMMFENEDEILELTKQAQQYVELFKMHQNPDVVNRPSQGSQYTGWSEIDEQRLVSKIHEVIQNNFRELIIKLRDTSKLNPSDDFMSWKIKSIPFIIQLDPQLAGYAKAAEKEYGTDLALYPFVDTAFNTEVSPAIINKNRDIINPKYKNSLGDQVSGHILDYMIKSNDYPYSENDRHLLDYL